MDTRETPAPGAKEAKALLKYIDYLVEAKGGAASAYPLNEYRKDAVRGHLIRELSMLANNYDSKKVPDFMPFAKSMLKRTAKSAAYREGSKQRTHSEGAFGYASLDAPLDTASDAPEASLHDCLADAAGAMRGIRGERLRRFYRVVARLDCAERRVLEALMDCDMKTSLAATKLNLTRHAMRKIIERTFAHFRAIWRLLD